MKQAPPVGHPVIAQVPDLSDSFQIPLKVLQKRIATHGSVPTPEVLIQWSGLPPSLATWENLDDLKRRFHQAPALGLAGSFGGGSVSSTHDDGDEEAALVGPRKSTRERRPNKRVTGTDWAK